MSRYLKHITRSNGAAPPPTHTEVLQAAVERQWREAGWMPEHELSAKCSHSKGFDATIDLIRDELGQYDPGQAHLGLLSSDNAEVWLCEDMWRSLIRDSESGWRTTSALDLLIEARNTAKDWPRDEEHDWVPLPELRRSLAVELSASTSRDWIHDCVPEDAKRKDYSSVNGPLGQWMVREDWAQRLRDAAKAQAQQPQPHKAWYRTTSERMTTDTGRATSEQEGRWYTTVDIKALHPLLTTSIVTEWRQQLPPSEVRRDGQFYRHAEAAVNALVEVARQQPTKPVRGWWTAALKNRQSQADDVTPTWQSVLADLETARANLQVPPIPNDSGALYVTADRLLVSAIEVVRMLADHATEGAS